MIQFPKQAMDEWEAANAARAKESLRKRLDREMAVEREVERLRMRHEARKRFQAELNAAK